MESRDYAAQIYVRDVQPRKVPVACGQRQPIRKAGEDSDTDPM